MRVQALLLVIAAGYWCAPCPCMHATWMAFATIPSRSHLKSVIACWIDTCQYHACSITRDNLGPYRAKVIYIPSVFLVTTLVRIRLSIATSRCHPDITREILQRSDNAQHV